LEKKKEQLLKESADVLAQQAEARSALWEEILRVDKRAEELLGVDDEASDKLFARKHILEKKLQDLDSTHLEVNEQCAKVVANLRMQTKDLPKRSGAMLHKFREAIKDVKALRNDKFESLFYEWLIHGEDSKFSELLSWQPVKDLTEVPEILCRSWGLDPVKCNSQPDIKAAFSKVFREVQVCLTA
jgi:hypothetical protein